jgi:hypothetical protein
MKEGMGEGKVEVTMVNNAQAQDSNGPGHEGTKEVRRLSSTTSTTSTTSITMDTVARIKTLATDILMGIHTTNQTMRVRRPLNRINTAPDPDPAEATL